jgi:hypothetical protein
LQLHENMWRLRPELWQQKNWLFITTHSLAFPLSPTIFFTQKNMADVPHPPYFFLFPRLKIKLKDSPFWHNWGDRGRVASSAQHSDNTTPGGI